MNISMLVWLANIPKHPVIFGKVQDKEYNSTEYEMELIKVEEGNTVHSLPKQGREILRKRLVGITSLFWDIEMEEDRKLLINFWEGLESERSY